MVVYKSKIRRWPVVVLVFFLGTSLIMAAYAGNPIGLVILSLIILFIVDVYRNTNYTIQDDILIIRCSVYTTAVYIRDITKIENTSSAFHAPALSLNRLAIFYGGYVVISPKNKAGFVAHLQKINPAIKYLPKG